jgi:hypothetical protein
MRRREFIAELGLVMPVIGFLGGGSSYDDAKRVSALPSLGPCAQ